MAHLVDDHMADLCKRRVRLELLQQHARRAEEQAGAARLARVEADGVTDNVAWVQRGGEG